MKNRLLMKMAAICMAAFMVTTPVSASAATILKSGSRGSEVKTVQSALKELGYFKYSKLTGYYGNITKTAVKRFQKDNGTAADGIVGKKTLALLNEAIEGKNSAESDKSAEVQTKQLTVEVQTEQVTAEGEAEQVTEEGQAEQVTAVAKKAEAPVSKLISTLMSVGTSGNMLGDLDWFKQVRSIWNRGEVALVTDVDTGKSFQVKRTYGTNHADVEPLTKKDTGVIKDIWGGFSWERRAVVVEINGYVIAGSMTAMPHAGVDSKAANKYVSNRSAGYGRGINLDAVKGNGCSGVMDIHFKNSRTHTTNRLQSVQQNMVKKAASYIKELVMEL